MTPSPSPSPSLSPSPSPSPSLSSPIGGRDRAVLLILPARTCSSGVWEYFQPKVSSTYHGPAWKEICGWMCNLLSQIKVGVHVHMYSSSHLVNSNPVMNKSLFTVHTKSPQLYSGPLLSVMRHSGGTGWFKFGTQPIKTQLHVQHNQLKTRLKHNPLCLALYF